MKKTLLTVLFVAGLASVSYADNWGIALRFGGPGVPAGSFFYHDGHSAHRARVYARPHYSVDSHAQRPYWYKKHVYHKPPAQCKKCHW